MFGARPMNRRGPARPPRTRPESTRLAAARGPLVFFTDFLLLLVTLLATLLCFLTSFQQTAFFNVLLPACLLLSFLSCVVFSLPCARVSALAILASGLAHAAQAVWSSIFLGGSVVAAEIYNLLSAKFDGLSPVNVPAQTQVLAKPLFFLFCLIVLSFLLGFAIVRRRSVLWTALFSLTLVLPGILSEYWPWWPGFLALTACLIAMALGAGTTKKAPAETARLTLICLPAAAALLAVLSLALPRESYVQPDWALRAYGQLIDLGHDLSERYERGGLAEVLPGLTAGSSETVDLAGAGPRSYSGKTMLRVTADASRRLYLRGCSSGNYTGGSWKPLRDTAYDTMPVHLELQATGQPLYFPARTQPDRAVAEVTVRNLRAPGRYVYAPYDLNPTAAIAEGEFDQDVGLRTRGGERKHTLSFYPHETALTAFQPLTGEAARAELTYRAFVYQNYLDVPDDFMTRLAPWYERASQAIQGLPFDGYDVAPQFENAVVTSRYWAQMLHATTRYDLSAPETPDGADFVEHFLNESGVGYCMHYATAATLLMRASGIPARYVSGFLLDAQPGANYVPDSSAHAWMEIYLDGYGWYPVEVTPAAGVDGTAQPAPPDETVPEEAPPEPEPKPKPEPEPDTPAPKPDAPDSPDEGGAQTHNAAKRWWLLPILALLLAGVLQLRRIMSGKIRQRRMDRRNPNAAVIAAYVYLGALVPWGAQTTQQMEDLARKAKFSQHTLTRDECAAVLDYVAAEAARADGALPPHKRLALRYIWALY